MRTTIKLDDGVFRAYKERAVANGTTFAHELESVLRADLEHGHSRAAAAPPFTLHTFSGDGSGALVDVNDNQALQDLVDEEAGYGDRTP